MLLCQFFSETQGDMQIVNAITYICFKSQYKGAPEWSNSPFEVTFALL